MLILYFEISEKIYNQYFDIEEKLTQLFVDHKNQKYLKNEF
tara:strand:+ start:35 stop:157 length:123 start_codon:yes stop_codon:yes gene_type:complete